MSEIPDAVAQWCRTSGHGGVAASEPLSGGCVSQTRRLRCADGASLVLKQMPGAPTTLFASEAAGLRAIAAAPGAPRAPTVLLDAASFLLMEDLPAGPRADDYWPRFGRELAALHDTHGPHFGFDCDGFCGPTPQPNTPTDDGHAFFAEQRLRHQARLARDAGLLDADGARLIEALCDRLTALIPEQPPSLIHGDLWSGNAHSTPDGAPALIDPAAHWSWAEAELGMTALFGGFPEAFYHAYEEARPLAAGWRQRLDIYNVYHLLNHANIFGGGYLSQALSACRRFV